jgi:hypothetical protein
MFAKSSNHKGVSQKTLGGRKISPQILPEQMIFAVAGAWRMPRTADTASRCGTKCDGITKGQLENSSPKFLTLFGKYFLRRPSQFVKSSFAIAGAIAPAPEAKQPSNENVPPGANQKTEPMLMKRNLFFLLALTSFAIALHPSAASAKSPKPTSTKTEKTVTSAEVVQAAHGWSYVKGEWIHPDGYKFVKGQILRTTARTGKVVPEAPGKLALDNPEKLTLKAPAPQNTKTPAETAAEIRRKNMEVRSAPQTGSHM